MLLVTAGVLRGESAAGVQWKAPSGWVSEPPRPMRAATYDVPGPAGSPERSQCIVYFFGANQGGTVEANLTRWKGQILGSDGKEAAAKVLTRTIHGLRVTTMDSSGTYTGMGGPMAATPVKPAPGYPLLGAIVQAPGGNLFIKFAGPSGLVGAAAHNFEMLLDSFAPETRK
jgi:hypothetical protein